MIPNDNVAFVSLEGNKSESVKIKIGGNEEGKYYLPQSHIKHKKYKRLIENPYSTILECIGTLIQWGGGNVK